MDYAPIQCASEMRIDHHARREMWPAECVLVHAWLLAMSAGREH